MENAEEQPLTIRNPELDSLETKGKDEEGSSIEAEKDAQGGTINESDATKGLNILNYWYPLVFSKDFPNDRPIPVQLYSEPLVLFRGKNNEVICLQDRCAHRSVPLSIGTLKNGSVECRYHGWQFSNEGKCTRVPSLAPDEPIPKSIRVPSYPATEREGMIWVWPGDPEKCDLNTGFPEKAWELESKDFVIVDEPIDMNTSYWNLVENLLDPAHLQFAHEGQQGKNIGSTDDTFPELSKFEMADTTTKGGFQGMIEAVQTKKHLRFKLVFDPPVTIRLEVAFPNGWRFNQMHYCTPTTEGKTKMLLRSMRDWLRFIPESQFMASNSRVLIQDKLVLDAQKVRLEQGATRWNYPVKADALSIRYRRWRDVVEPRSKPWFKGYFGSSFKKGGGVKRGACSLERGQQNHNADSKSAGPLEIEDLPNCCGACDNNVAIMEDINKQAPNVWPSAEKFKEPVVTIKKVGQWTAQGLFYGGYLLAVAVAIFTLTKA